MSKLDYITKLPLDKQAIALDYWNKWLKIAYSTERIKQQDVHTAVKTVYAILRIPEPKIFFLIALVLL